MRTFWGLDVRIRRSWWGRCPCRVGVIHGRDFHTDQSLRKRAIAFEHKEQKNGEEIACTRPGTILSWIDFEEIVNEEMIPSSNCWRDTGLESRIRIDSTLQHGFRIAIHPLSSRRNQLTTSGGSNFEEGWASIPWGPCTFIRRKTALQKYKALRDSYDQAT